MKILKRYKNNNFTMHLVVLLASLLIAFFRCGASPFINYYPVDSPVYITMGKAIKYGLTLYKDIGDHKGFYVYIFNYIGSLISLPNFKFFALFFVELIEIYITLFFGYKTIKLFSEDAFVNKLSFIGLLCVYLYKGNFGKGNRPETFMLTFMMIGVYYIFKCILIDNKKNNKFFISNFTSFIIGATVAIIYNLKQNYVMVFSAILILYLFMLLDKNYKKCIQSILFAGIGFIIFMLPMIFYIIFTDSVYDYIRWTLIYNFVYIIKPRDFVFLNINFPKAVYPIYKHIYYFIKPENYYLIPVHILPFLSLFFLKKFNIKFKITYIYMTIVALLIISMNGEKNMAYPIYLVPFSLIFIINIINFFLNILYKLYLFNTKYFKHIFLSIIILLFILLNAFSIKNFQTWFISDYEINQVNYVLNYCKKINIAENRLKLFSDKWAYSLYTYTNIKVQKNNMFIPYFYDAEGGHIDYIKRYHNFLDNDFDMLIVGSIESYKDIIYDDPILNTLNEKFIEKLAKDYYYTGEYGVYLSNKTLKNEN